ncbi:1554_t:CDS:2 [Ambispora leptoticha]|uniref:1554_t:CDS:1 n=1 Tax=Ambispora leptoticha TaxID=144679 RepID=A0A9N9CPE6_9GLOM|nr:1554_t:CDS:2 [Ambispora leptoticha]
MSNNTSDYLGLRNNNYNRIPSHADPLLPSTINNNDAYIYDESETEGESIIAGRIFGDAAVINQRRPNTHNAITNNNSSNYNNIRSGVSRNINENNDTEDDESSHYNEENSPDSITSTTESNSNRNTWDIEISMLPPEMQSSIRKTYSATRTDVVHAAQENNNNNNGSSSSDNEASFVTADIDESLSISEDRSRTTTGVDEADESNLAEDDESIFSHTSINIKSNSNSSDKNILNMTIDTDLTRPSRRKTRFVARSPTSSRYTRKRAIIRRASTKLISANNNNNNSSNSSQSSISTKYASSITTEEQNSTKYSTSTSISSEDSILQNANPVKADLKTLEISGELEEIDAQFQESLNKFSKNYQDSTVALAERSQLMKRNQELMHTLAAKEEEIEYLKNELWSSEKKIQDYQTDMQVMMEQQQEPLILSLEDLSRIEKEIENQEALIRGYQVENGKLTVQLKEAKAQLEHVVKENELQATQVLDLMEDIKHLNSAVNEKDSTDYVSEAVLQQMDEMKQEIHRLKEKEATLIEKEIALKEMDEMKKELAELKDRESNYMIKIDDLENQLDNAREENETSNRTNTEAMERLTEEMNMMKFTYESQIEGINKQLSTKDGRELRFKKLITAMEQIEDAAGRNAEVARIYSELRRNKSLPPRKRRKSVGDPSKELPASPTRKATRRRSPSQSSLGGRSRASTMSGRASPTPSVLSYISGISQEEFVDFEENPEITELKEKIKKLEESKSESDASREKLEDDVKLLKEVKERLDEEIRTLKRDAADRKEEYEKKLREMEEILLEFNTESTGNAEGSNADNDDSETSAPSTTTPVIPPNVIEDLEKKQGIIEELVEKLKRKEESLVYYQNAYLAKVEELEKYVEATKKAVAVAASSAKDGAIDYLSNSVPMTADLASLPITSEFLAGLGDGGEFNVIERLIAQLERTIVERTMQLDAAHQRATEAETKLVSLSKEKLSWGVGYDKQMKALNKQVQELNELLQMERKNSRRVLAAAAAAKQQSSAPSVVINGLHNVEKSKDKVTASTAAIAAASTIEKFQVRIETLTAENNNLRIQFEALQKMHEETMNILTDSQKSSLANKDLASLKILTIEKEAEIGVLKGRLAGLENVVKRQKAILAKVLPSSLSNGDAAASVDTKYFVENDSIDDKSLKDLSEAGAQIVQNLREENALLRQAIAAACHQQSPSNKNDTAEIQKAASKTAQSFETLASQIAEMEHRFAEREKELLHVIEDTKKQFETVMKKLDHNKV